MRIKTKSNIPISMMINDDFLFSFRILAQALQACNPVWSIFEIKFFQINANVFRCMWDLFSEREWKRNVHTYHYFYIFFFVCAINDENPFSLRCLNCSQETWQINGYILDKTNWASTHRYQVLQKRLKRWSYNEFKKKWLL